MRRLAYAAGGLVALTLGVATSMSVGEIEGDVAPEPIVVDWPSPPGPPASQQASMLTPLPVPAGWDGSADLSNNTLASQPGPIAPESAPMPMANVAGHPPAGPETPDDLVVRRAAGAASSRPSANVSPPTSTARVPAGTVAAEARREQPDQRVESGSANQPPAMRTGDAPVSTSGTGGTASPVRSAVPNQPPVAPAPDSPRPSTAPKPEEPRLPNTGGRGPEPVRPLQLAEAPAATGSPAPAVVAPPRVDPRASVRTALERYRSAYQRLDAAAARAVWPSVDAGALARAFSSLSSQELWFEGCEIEVAGAGADATCTGHSRVVPKIGGGSETTKRTWRFKLRPSGTDWIIDSASVK